MSIVLYVSSLTWYGDSLRVYGGREGGGGEEEREGVEKEEEVYMGLVYTCIIFDTSSIQGS